MAIAIRNEGAKVNSNINVTPMVDVMLVLLIIFMVITPMLAEGRQRRLGESEQSGANAGCGQRRRAGRGDHARRQSVFRERSDPARPAHRKSERSSRKPRR